MQFSTQTKIYGSAAALVHPAVRMLQDAGVAIKEGPCDFGKGVKKRLKRRKVQNMNVNIKKVSRRTN